MNNEPQQGPSTNPRLTRLNTYLNILSNNPQLQEKIPIIEILFKMFATTLPTSIDEIPTDEIPTPPDDKGKGQDSIEKMLFNYIKTITLSDDIEVALKFIAASDSESPEFDPLSDAELRKTKFLSLYNDVLRYCEELKNLYSELEGEERYVQNELNELKNSVFKYWHALSRLEFILYYYAQGKNLDILYDESNKKTNYYKEFEEYLKRIDTAALKHPQATMYRNKELSDTVKNKIVNFINEFKKHINEFMQKISPDQQDVNTLTNILNKGITTLLFGPMGRIIDDEQENDIIEIINKLYSFVEDRMPSGNLKLEQLNTAIGRWKEDRVY